MIAHRRLLVGQVIVAVLWLVWREYDTDFGWGEGALAVFVVHLVFNLGWSATFFGQQWIG